MSDVSNEQFIGIIEAQRDLIRKVVAKVRKSPMARRVNGQDLWDYAVVGLFHAVRHYDFNRGPFENFAYRWVKAYTIGRLAEDVGRRLIYNDVTSINQRERTKTFNDVAEREYEEHKRATRDALRASIQVDDIRNNLCYLKASHRDVVERWIAGQSPVEQALELGHTAEAIRKQLREATKKLRSLAA